MSKLEESNFAYCQETLELVDNIESGFLLLGERLYNIREKQLYKPQWESFHEFTMELKGFSSASVSKLLGIYETFCLNFEIPKSELLKARGWTSLAMLLPIAQKAQSQKDVLDLVHQAQVLSQPHLRQNLIEIKRGKDMSSCAHERAVVIRTCSECGLKERVYDST